MKLFTRAALLAAAATTVFAAADANAAISLKLYIDDLTTPVFTVVDNGALDTAPQTGNIVVSDSTNSLFSWDFHMLLGVPALTDPSLGAQSTIQASSSFTGSHTVRAVMTQTDLTNLSLLDTTLGINSNLGAGGTAQAYINADNSAFGMGTLIDTLAVGAGLNGSNETFHAGVAAAPFSETVVFTLNFTSAGQFTQTNAQISPAAVPEPASWAMMVGGFGLLGGALRRKRNAAVSFG